MQTLHVNGYDMAYLEVGEGPPLVCVHGSLCDFRIWSAVLGPLSKQHRVIAVSLRHFFPDRWDGIGDTYSIAQPRQRRHRLRREAGHKAGRSDGPFPWRTYRVSRRAAPA